MRCSWLNRFLRCIIIATVTVLYHWILQLIRRGWYHLSRILLLLLLVDIVMKPRDQSIMIYQGFSFLFVVAIAALIILRTFTEHIVTFALSHIVTLIRIGQGSVYIASSFSILLLYHWSTSTIKRFQWTFSAWVNIIVILIAKALYETLSWKVIIKVTTSHQDTIIDTESLIP